MGVPILPLDINKSTEHYRVERLPDQRLGIRLSFNGIRGLSQAETQRLVAGQPYTTIDELRHRAKLSRPNIRRLAELGALDAMHHDAGGAANRADLIRHLTAISAQKTVTRHQHITDGQLTLPFEGDPELSGLPAELPDVTPVEQLKSELDLMHLDVSAHVMDTHRALLDSLGVTTADKLLGLRNGTEVLVAGIRVATQTPPMRGNKRVVFISIDDGTGCVDATFFTEAQERSGPLLFNTELLLIHGKTRRTGPSGISIGALEAWDLRKTETLPAPGHLGSSDRARDSWQGNRVGVRELRIGEEPPDRMSAVNSDGRERSLS